LWGGVGYNGEGEREESGLVGEEGSKFRRKYLMAMEINFLVTEN
jgi:hypothetical protein